MHRLAVLEEFTLPEWLSDPHAMDFIDVTTNGLTEEQVAELAADQDLVLDENEDEDGEPFNEDDDSCFGI